MQELRYEHSPLRYGLDQPTAIAPCGRGFHFTYRAVWRDDHGQPMLDETPTIAVYADVDATPCDAFSAKTFACGPIENPASTAWHARRTHSATIAALPGWGDPGQKCRDGPARAGRHGHHRPAMQVHRLQSGWARSRPLQRMPDHSGEHRVIRPPGAVVRAMFSTSMRDTIRTAVDDIWIAGLRVEAYDGALDDARARRWYAASRR
jgi:hypothetical protein